MNDSGGKFTILGPVESDDAQTVSGLPHIGSKKAVYRHGLWEPSPLFGFPTRVMNAVPTPVALGILLVFERFWGRRPLPQARNACFLPREHSTGVSASGVDVENEETYIEIVGRDHLFFHDGIKAERSSA